MNYMKFYCLVLAGLMISTAFWQPAQASKKKKLLGALLIGAALAAKPKLLPLPIPIPIPMKMESKKYVPVPEPIPVYSSCHKPVYAEEYGGYDDEYYR